MIQIICCFVAAEGANKLFSYLLSLIVFNLRISLASYLQESLVLVVTKLLILQMDIQNKRNCAPSFAK